VITGHIGRFPQDDVDGGRAQIQRGAQRESTRAVPGPSWTRDFASSPSPSATRVVAWTILDHGDLLATTREEVLPIGVLQATSTFECVLNMKESLM
jgi:hypothetical protein